MKVKLDDLLVAVHTPGGYGEARRLIRGGGALVNGKVQKSIDKVIDIPSEGVILSVGRKKHAHVGFVISELAITDADLEGLAKKED